MRAGSSLIDNQCFCLGSQMHAVNSRLWGSTTHLLWVWVYVDAEGVMPRTKPMRDVVESSVCTYLRKGAT